MSNVYRNICLWVIRVGAFLIPFIPLLINRDLFFPYITGKAFAFRIIVEIIFACWLFLILFHREYVPKKNVLILALALFLAVVTLSTVFGENPSKSLWSNFERMEGLVTYLHLGAYFVVLGSVFRRQDWTVFFNLFVISGIGENIFALLQKLGYFASPQGGVRVDGTIGNPTYLAAYSIFLLAFAVVLWFYSKNKLASYYYGATILFTLATIYFTATRGVILALLIAAFLFGIGYLFLASPKTERERLYKKTVFGLLSFLVVLPLVFLLVRNTSFVDNSPVLARFRNISLGDARSYIWSMAWEGFKENPVLGWGPENFDLVFSKHYRPELYDQEPWFDRSHNIVLDWLINAGILGLLSYLGVFAAAFYLLWQNFKKKFITLEIFTIIAILFVVYFVQNLFVFDNLATYISFYAFLAYIYSINASGESLVLSSQIKEKDKALTHRSFANVDYAPFWAAAIFVPLGFVLYMANFKPFLANYNLLDALRYGASSQINESNLAFQRAFAYNTFANKEITEQYIRFADSIASNPSIPEQFKIEVFQRALDEGGKRVQENPFDVRAYLFLGTTFNRVSLFDQAIAVLNQAIELAPTKQQIYFELGDVYIRKGDYNKAAEVLDKALSLEPRFGVARLNAAAAYILAGRQDKADALLLEAYKTVDYPDRILFQTYAKIQKYDRLLRLQKTLVEQRLTDWEARVDLARIYLLMNRKGDAVGALEEAIKLNPSYKDTGESVIQKIKTSNGEFRF